MTTHDRDEDGLVKVVKENEMMIKFLKECGLDSASVDPISLRALDEFMAAEPALKPEPALASVGQEVNKIKETVAEMEKSGASLTGAMDQNLEMLAAATSCETVSATHQSPQLGTAAGRHVPTNEQILQQLKLQTQVIIDIHKRLDALTSLVEEVASRQIGPPVGQDQLPPSNVPSWRQRARPFQHRSGPPQEPVDAVPVEVPRARNAEPPEEQQPRMTLFGHITAFCSSIVAAIRQSRFAQLCQVLVALHRRHIRIEGGMIFKVLLMVGIYSAKTMSRKRAPKGFWSPTTKFYLMIALVFIGFLIRAGYLKLFQEFIKEDYIGRIYRGEQVEVDGRPQPRPRHEALNLRNLIPQNILGGRIPNPAGAVNNPLVDFFILVGSFLLSILPMWNPQGEVIQEAQEVEGEQEGEQEVAADQNEMPPVGPPRDLDEFAASDDDDEADGDAGEDEEEELTY